MMNYIWSFIFLISFSYACLTSNLSTFADSITLSSTEAIQFIISLGGIMALWSGLMEIAERTGLINSMSRILLPLTSILFPHQKNTETISSIIMSFMANIFGAGNSSTVFALRTMEKLDSENNHSPIASNDMCTFAVVNMAFAPLVPIVSLQMRANLGSADPYSIVIPSIITALCTITVSALACKFFERRG